MRLLSRATSGVRDLFLSLFQLQPWARRSHPAVVLPGSHSARAYWRPWTSGPAETRLGTRHGAASPMSPCSPIARARRRGAARSAGRRTPLGHSAGRSGVGEMRATYASPRGTRAVTATPPRGPAVARPLPGPGAAVASHARGICGSAPSPAAFTSQRARVVRAWLRRDHRTADSRTARIRPANGGRTFVTAEAGRQKMDNPRRRDAVSDCPQLPQLIENNRQAVRGCLLLFRSTFLRSQRSQVRILPGVPTALESSS